MRQARPGTATARAAARFLGAALALAALVVTGCAPAGSGPTSDPNPTDPSSTVPPTAPSAPNGAQLLQPAGAPRDLATRLEVPWSVISLGDGAALMSERDTARVLELTASGDVREAGVVAGVQAGGEGGLLGIALSPLGDELYAYFTAVDDNRVMRMPLLGESGERSLGAPTLVLKGIPKAGNHNGGRLAFGHDGMLYITTGDAGSTEHAQNLDSLGGKILRVTPEGRVPDDNPFGHSPVFSYGHRNVQGIAWDSTGRLWASEFGQNTWDELNLIEAGGNYGWPAVEGRADCAEPGSPACESARFIDPVLQWRTDQASPSGIAVIGGTLFIASLRGERLWTVDVSGSAIGEPREWYRGEYGRLRDAVAGPGGTLWLLTNNTARGTPRQGDDRLMEVRLDVSGRG
ncbi:PQQ-dependent sugar dehydrogenase [Ruicaihuangia caeni]|uniref:PQQ-dependent sugar dehydrogenase n=1 Tax=Ruicaihuangia caeni TaxID=3042517 RepID=A0AAW6TBV3_9MICO|nr:PQQ-dependent sugar dehydrogenase [Klugiella sp. YN-L-19]MDI2098522.1 PQQ-dependent sugar dehydrogenase [Klugiella sp. YN-L-19]